MNPILPQRVEKIKGGSAIDHGGDFWEWGVWVPVWCGEGTGARGTRSRAR